MRNLILRSGVYCTMRNVTLLLIGSFATCAQPTPEQDAFDSAFQSIWQAREAGHFQDAAAAREQARALLLQTPVTSPVYVSRAQQVAEAYQTSGLNSKARAILEEALARTAKLGESDPAHQAMLVVMGGSWWENGNLLKAAVYMEQALAIKVAGEAPEFRGSSIDACMHLAQLYQQLGRPDAVAAVAARLGAIAPDGMVLAQFYEQRGQLDEAAAIYRKQVEQAADPQAKSNAWQQLAALEARGQQFTDAAAAMQQAIDSIRQSQQPGAVGPAQWMRQNLANYLRQAGQLDAADQIYQQLLQEARGGPQETQTLSSYSMYLAETKRGAQAESLLKDYLAAGANLEPQERATALFSLGNVAQREGDTKSAEEYRKSAQALQPQEEPPPAGEIHVAEDVAAGQTALNQQRLEDAYVLALQALGVASQAVDRDQAEWFVPQVAGALAAAKQQGKAEQLFERLFSLVETWKVDTLQPTVTAAQNYARFLMNQPDRASQVPAAIERYRNALAEAEGLESGSLAEAVRMKVEWERNRRQWQQAEGSAKELLELQESLSGNTSEPYLRDLQVAAGVFTAADEDADALPLFRRAVAIADLIALNRQDWRRSETRMDLALTLARLRQFDEAEAQALDAVAMDGASPHPRVDLLQKLEQVRQMKRAAAAEGK